MSETADVGDDCVKLDLQHGTAVEFTIIFRFVDTFKQTDLLLKLIITFSFQGAIGHSVHFPTWSIAPLIPVSQFRHSNLEWLQKVL